MNQTTKVLEKLPSLKKALKLKSALFLNADERHVSDIAEANEVLSNVFVQQIATNAFRLLNKKVQFLSKAKAFHYSPFGVLSALLECNHTKRYKLPVLVLDITEDVHVLVADYAEAVVDQDCFFPLSDTHLNFVNQELEHKKIMASPEYSFEDESGNTTRIVRFVSFEYTTKESSSA